MSSERPTFASGSFAIARFPLPKGQSSLIICTIGSCRDFFGAALLPPAASFSFRLFAAARFAACCRK